MDNKVINLEERISILANRSWNAEVVEIEHFEATNVYLPALNKEVNIYAHSASVPPLKVGDMVLVECIESNYIVTHRLRQHSERPQCGFTVNNDGVLEVSNANGILIQANQSRIEVKKDGQIFVDGKEIYSIAGGKHLLQGTTIELN